MIVALEGVSGAGKTTISELLATEADAVVVPELLVTAQQENRFTESDYFAHDVRKHEIASNLGKDGLCVMDRSYVSFQAFRYATSKKEWVADEKQPVEPDHYIYLRISPATSAERRGDHSKHWGDHATISRAVQFYDDYFSERGKKVSIIDADKPLNEVLREIKIAIRAVC